MMSETHLARTKSIYVWFPLVVGRDTAGACCTAHLAPPRTTPDIANDITIAAKLFTLARCIIDNRVDPASEELPASTAILGSVNVVDMLFHGYIEVPCHDETIATPCIENASGGRATDELGGSVECEGRDTKAVSRFVFVVLWMESRLWVLCGVGDQDGVD